MLDGSPPPSLNPVPRSLLDQFLQELYDLGLSERQVQGHLVYLRLWQKYLTPLRLLDATPDDLSGFFHFLREQGLKSGEVRFAEEAVEHFYAFTLDRNPAWEEHAAWEALFAVAPRVRKVPLWEAITHKLRPHFRRADPGILAWPPGFEGDRPEHAS